MLSGEPKRFREEADVRFGRAHDGDRACVLFDNHYGTRAYAGHQRSEVGRCFRFRDVDDIFSHVEIIHPSLEQLSSVILRSLFGIPMTFMSSESASESTHTLEMMSCLEMRPMSKLQYLLLRPEFID